MNLDDLKDQLKDGFNSLSARVQESSAYIQLSEKFQNLTPNAQKAVLASGACFVALLLLWLPYSYYSSSQDTVAEFEEKKELIRELFRVSRDSAILQSAPPSASASSLISLAQNKLSMAPIPPEQIQGVTEYDNTSKPNGVIPKNVIQKGVQVSVSKLNLRQLVDLGYQLQSMHPSAKMVGMEITANREDVHYFDVIYRVVSFSLPEPPPPKMPAPKPGSKRAKPAVDDEENF